MARCVSKGETQLQSLNQNEIDINHNNSDLQSDSQSNFEKSSSSSALDSVKLARIYSITSSEDSTIHNKEYQQQEFENITTFPMKLRTRPLKSTSEHLKRYKEKLVLKKNLRLDVRNKLKFLCDKDDLSQQKKSNKVDEVQVEKENVKKGLKGYHKKKKRNKFARELEVKSLQQGIQDNSSEEFEKTVDESEMQTVSSVNVNNMVDHCVSDESRSIQKRKKPTNKADPTKVVQSKIQCTKNSTSTAETENNQNVMEPAFIMINEEYNMDENSACIHNEGSKSYNKKSRLSSMNLQSNNVDNTINFENDNTDPLKKEMNQPVQIDLIDLVDEDRESKFNKNCANEPLSHVNSFSPDRIHKTHTTMYNSPAKSNRKINSNQTIYLNFGTQTNLVSPTATENGFCKKSKNIRPTISDNELSEMCGISLTVFNAIVAQLPETISNDISRESKLVIFLMILKQGMSCSMLEIFFDMPQNEIIEIFEEILEHMKSAMKFLVYWPLKVLISKNMPEIIKKEHPNCQSIIDCIDINIEIPETEEDKKQFYETLMNCQTFKLFISCTPSGFVSYKSACICMQHSDTYLIDRSFFNFVKADDVILSNKKFVGLSDALKCKKVALIEPPFTDNPSNVAPLNVHVFKCTNQIKAFKILSNFPMKFVAHIDDIVNICCSIINLKIKLTETY